jgi:hypothetical protein
MNRLAVGQQNNSQVTVLHFRDMSPAPDSTVGLYHLANRASDCAFNPLIPD